MNRKAKVGAILAVGLLASSVITGCSTSAGETVAEDCTPKWEFPTITDGTLTVAIYEAMPYFGDVAGQREGIDHDFLEEFAADACLEVDWQVQPASSVIQAVASGRADVAGGGWYATEERGEIVSLSDPTYVELPTISSFDGTADIEDLRGKVVGTISGYTWNAELAEIAGEVREYQGADATLQDLAAKRIDYALVGGIDGPYIVTQNASLADIKTEIMDPNPAISSSVNPQLPNLCHTKGNNELTKALNSKIAEAHDSGRYAEILEAYGLDARLADVQQYQ